MTKLNEGLQALIARRQHNRIMRLSFPAADGPECELLVNQLDAQEAVSRDFVYTLELISDHPKLELKSLLGKLLCVELVLQNGSLRYFTGHCFSFSLVKVDGALAYYEAELGPWLRYLQLRKDNYLFHRASLHDQTASIFRDYATVANWDWRVRGDDPAMTDACQFNESDHNYLHRRWEAAGFLYWYEHCATGHTLVVSDKSTSAKPIDGVAKVPFQRQGGAVEEDGIAEWSPIRHLMPGSVTLSSFNFKHPRRPFGNQVCTPTVNRQGAVLALDSYEYTGAFGYKTNADAGWIGRVRMEEMEAAGKQFRGKGNNRNLMPGRCFELIGHFDENDGAEGKQTDFYLLDVRHVATNNYVHTDQQPHYANELTCIRNVVPWRPGRGFNSRETLILGAQTATVVGPAGPDSVHVDEYSRVRVQFHWDRVGKYDDGSSAWMRVTSMWAGSQLGATAIPRVGSEVCVVFLGGNPDRPIIIAAMANLNNMPPWSLPTQGALTGLRSRELKPNGGNAPGGRSNHLILDDTHTAIQAQLKSDHADSQLSLGNITRIAGNAGRADARGEGWELATDAWGVARAAKGMLLTTEARPNARGHIKDMSETLQRLTVAQENHAAMADLAQQAGAQEAAQQIGVAAAVQAQNESIQGMAGDFPELATPLLVLASPAGIVSSTDESTHLASSKDTALTAGASVSITAGASLFASVRQTLRLFVQQAGMKLVAFGGDIDIQALSDSIKLLAKLNITQTANRITISAREELVLNGGGSYAIYNANGIEQGTSGNNVVHAAKHSLIGAKNQAAPTIDEKSLQAGPERLHYTLQTHLGGRLLAGVPYALHKGAAKVEDGITDSWGRLPIKHEAGTPQYTVKLPGGDEFVVDVKRALAKHGEPAHQDDSLANKGARAVDGSPAGRLHR